MNIFNDRRATARRLRLCVYFVSGGASLKIIIILKHIIYYDTQLKKLHSARHIKYIGHAIFWLIYIVIGPAGW